MQTLIVKELPDGSCRAALVEGGAIAREFSFDDVSDIYQWLKEEDHPQHQDIIPLYDL